MTEKWTRRFSLLLAIMIILTAAINQTVVYATENPVTKVTGQPIKNGIDLWGKSGDTAIMPFWGNFYYSITVNLAKSPKKTKVKMKYTHQIRPSRHGAVKLTVGKKTVVLRRFESFPYIQYGHGADFGYTTNIYLDSAKIRIDKKWKKLKITNNGVKSNGVHSELKDFTLKKIPKGTKLRMTFNVRVGVPRV